MGAGMESCNVELVLTYDRSVDVAYLYFRAIGRGEAERQVEAVRERIILDFDVEDRLIGIELLGAARVLPPELMRAFC
jgi:uncharacterized protein YuzE